MARNGDSLAYEMKVAALGEKSRNPNQSITDRDTIHSYKSSINRFVSIHYGSRYDPQLQIIN